MATPARSRCLRSVRRLLLTGGLALLAVTLLLGAAPTEAAPRRQSASELIDAVNRFRASNGLGPLNVDPILMLVAQRQNDYSTSIGQLTHYGPDGSRPRDQAMAAGYGGGATVFISENIAMGSSLSPGGAVEMWTGDAPHLNTMLGTNYRDVGAGVGEGVGFTYYTLVTGYVAGGLSANSTVPAGGSDVAIGGGPRLVVTVTPQPDGSIVHIVEEGQTLWTIAAVYGIDLAELLSLNGMTEDSFVHPGDRVIVRAGPTATATVAPTATPSPMPGQATLALLTGEPAVEKGPGFLAEVPAIAPRDLLAGACVAAWMIVVIAGLAIASRRL